MDFLFNKKFLQHNPDSYFEGAYRMHQFADLPDAYYDGEPFLELVHDKEYIESIKGSCARSEKLAEIQLNCDTFETACLSVGLTILAAEQQDFALVRPPGHHAARNKAEGFCLFNNIAIAAQKLVNEGKRVLIIDIDAHHGNGTQEIFYQNNKVLYCSIHQLYTYPLTGFPNERGDGDGKGLTLNFPLVQGSKDKDFLNALDKAITLSYEFHPDVVGISAGFDGYPKDRMLDLNYSLQAYYECGYRIGKSFKNVFAVLEGGYHDDLRLCADRFLEGINNGLKPSKIKWDPNMAIG